MFAEAARPEQGLNVVKILKSPKKNQKRLILIIL
jgi:hypothetical protein